MQKEDWTSLKAFLQEKARHHNMVAVNYSLLEDPEEDVENAYTDAYNTTLKEMERLEGMGNGRSEA
jgi:1,2-phenylacetyl-CoA epoxidase catalytic subunit